MPFWLLPLLSLVARYGIPYLEKVAPKLAPLLEILLAVLGGKAPTPALHSAADHYEKVCDGLICPPALVRE